VQQLNPVDLGGCDAGRLDRGGVALVVEIVDTDAEMVDGAHTLGVGGLNQAEKRPVVEVESVGGAARCRVDRS